MRDREYVTVELVGSYCSREGPWAGGKEKREDGVTNRTEGERERDRERDPVSACVCAAHTRTADKVKIVNV